MKRSNGESTYVMKLIMKSEPVNTAWRGVRLHPLWHEIRERNKISLASMRGKRDKATRNEIMKLNAK